MSTHQPRPLPPNGNGAAFRFVLTQAARSVDAMYRTADRLCCTHPAIAAHIRELADTFAGETLDSLRRWPAEPEA
jgi:hypothetical protein